MKKLIELTPEWVLENLSVEMSFDGYGLAYVSTDLDHYKWIMLALKTLKIPFIKSQFRGSTEAMFCFEFKIKDIQIDCPSLYESMMSMSISTLQSDLNKEIGLN